MAACPSTLLDDSVFTTVPFTLQDLYADVMDEVVGDVVPFDDTRQSQPEGGDPALDKPFGCSRFYVQEASVSSVPPGLGDKNHCVIPGGGDAPVGAAPAPSVVDKCVTPKKQSILSSTLTSPKYNSVNVAQLEDSYVSRPKYSTINHHVNNGPLSHSECKYDSF